jgi:hypothetical protein
MIQGSEPVKSRQKRPAPRVENGRVLRVFGNIVRKKFEAKQPVVLGLVDHPHTATAQLLYDAVVRDGLAGTCCKAGSLFTAHASLRIREHDCESLVRVPLESGIMSSRKNVRRLKQIPQTTLRRRLSFTGPLTIP